MSEEKKKISPGRYGKRVLARGSTLTLKQERHAQNLAAGMHFEAAWRNAYDCSQMQEMAVYKKSFSAQKHPKIVKRVAEIRELIDIANKAKAAGEKLPPNTLPVVREAVKTQAQAVERVMITRQTLTDMLMSDREKAHSLGQVSASVGAAKTLAQLHGLISDSRETKAEKTEIENMDVQQLRQFISAELTQVGLSPSDVGLDFVSMKPAGNKILN